MLGWLSQPHVAWVRGASAPGGKLSANLPELQREGCQKKSWQPARGLASHTRSPQGVRGCPAASPAQAGVRGQRAGVTGQSPGMLALLLP